MADGFRFRIEGVQQMNRALKEMGPFVATKVGASANRRAAKLVEEAVREAAPRGTGPTSKVRRLKSGVSRRYDYGRLYENIKLRQQRARKQHHIVHAVTTGNAFWGRFLEFGTKFIVANRWMSRAVTAVAEQALRAQMVELRAGIERAAARAAKASRRAVG